jgi:mannose-6-phosphate isomerase-like protein (cupin superfamily)
MTLGALKMGRMTSSHRHRSAQFGRIKCRSLPQPVFPMPTVISPCNVALSLTELWSPRVIGEVDDAYIKVAKVHGSLTWHTHDDEDELFYILKGRLRIEMKAGDVELGEGEMFVVPKGVRHNPVAEDECHLLLIERKTTLHTGSDVTDKTRSIDEQLRPV